MPTSAAPDFAQGLLGQATQQKVDLSSSFAITVNLASYVSASVPTNPINGDVWVYTADSTNGIKWWFIYNSSSASTYKWELLGGLPLSAQVLTSETTTSLAYADPATAGPSIVAPFAGEYVAIVYVWIRNSSATQDNYASASGSDNDAAFSTSAVVDNFQNAAMVSAPFACTAAQTVKLQYKTTGGTARWSHRKLTLIPVRVG